MDIKAAFRSMPNRRLVNLKRVRQMARVLIQWTESFFSERLVQMIIEGNGMQ